MASRGPAARAQQGLGGAALVHRPPVLFLDEPTTGLDPSGRSDLWALIEELVADGTTGGCTLAVTVADKGQTVLEVIRLLDADAVVPEALAIREPTLDDVFLQLTGHRAGTGRDGPNAEPAAVAGSREGFAA